MTVVEVGQVWRDCDPRMENRRLKVLRILRGVVDNRVLCQPVSDSPSGPGRIMGRTTQIRLDRLRTKFELVEEAFHLPTDEFCREVPEEAGAAPRHCFHPYRKGDAICCWCGDLFLDEQSTWQHGEYLPTHKEPEEK